MRCSKLAWIVVLALGACSGGDGTAGPPGLSGARGEPGAAGPTGATGPGGAAGPTGPDGATGPTGADGLRGPAGPVGASGATGALGMRGATGLMGLAGMAGATGAQGPVGPAGALGPSSPTMVCVNGQNLIAVAGGGYACASSLSSLTRGRTAANPGTSCANIKATAPRSEDGVYLIDPDGAGPIGQLRVLCDMTRDGGGWTLVLKNRYQSGMAGKSEGFGSLDDLDAHQADFYKLPDATINSIVGDGKFDLLGDQAGYNSLYSNGNHEYVLIRDYTATFTFTARVPESSTITIFESYRSSDNLLVWRGHLACGNVGGVGVNCLDVGNTASPIGAPNPQGGAGCLLPLGPQTNVGWHHFYMSDSNTDTYLYICNGAQHSSGYDLSHRWWVR